MRNPKFEMYKGFDDQFWFRLQAGNGENILKSEGYTEKHSCKDGIESVKKNAVHDSQFKPEVAGNAKPYFNLIAANGEIIGTSETYSSKQAMQKGIAAVKHDAPAAPIEDLT
ncbi:MAG: YegP family protein [candidate division Zixibacteria bacterium]|nr:YegP family protein [candidate division Zixibacteria bacterium]